MLSSTRAPAPRRYNTCHSQHKGSFKTLIPVSPHWAPEVGKGSNQMPSDDAIERYLDTVDCYVEAKSAAANAWREGFLQLARARLSQEVSYSCHDPSLRAEVTVDPHSLELNIHTQTNPLAGAWPSSSTRSAKASFLDALKHEIQAHLARKAQAVLP